MLIIMKIEVQWAAVLRVTAEMMDPIEQKNCGQTACR